MGKDFAAFEKHLGHALTRGSDTPRARAASVMFIAGVTAVVDQVTDLDDEQARDVLDDLVVSRLIATAFDASN